MSGDLEDFLRRAAKRRQTQASRQKQSQSTARRVRRQYSDARSERLARSPEEISDVDEVLTAQVIQDDAITDPRRSDRETADPPSRIEYSRHAAQRIPQQAKQPRSGRHPTQPGQAETVQVETVQAETKQTNSDPVANLLEVFRRPESLKQIILMREIFDRPEHRW